MPKGCRLKVLGYAVASPGEALADPVGFMLGGADLDPQRDAIQRWARARHHRLIRLVSERTDPDPISAAIRATVAAVPMFQGDIRSMRARFRMLRARGTDEEVQMVALERLEERGIPWRSLRLRGRALG